MASSIFIVEWWDGNEWHIVARLVRFEYAQDLVDKRDNYRIRAFYI